MSALDGNGHLFVILSDGGDFCVGCGRTKDAPEAAILCADAEGLAADMEVQGYVDRLRAVGV